MAVKNDKRKQKARPVWQNNDLQFASRRLSREEGEAFLAWLQSGTPDLEDAICKIIAATYKIGFRMDMNNSAQVCSFTMQDDRHPHHNVYLTSRSDDPIEAFYMNCYKVWFIYPDKPIAVDDSLESTWG